MDFFQHQERARRKTGLLVLYFVVAVVAVIASVTAAMLLILHFSGAGVSLQAPWAHPLTAWIALGTFVVIVGGCLVKTWQLRKGGPALAEMMGAKPIDATTTDNSEQRLLNVVEEMSIAAGIPAPRIYVLEQEPAINAFAAGFRPSEAIVAVTRGTLDKLSRDELQAIIGHEFSHILNADIRINLRMVAVLAGILAVGKVGEHLLHSQRHQSRSSRRNNKGNLVIVGLALMVIGYVGLFFGRLIKAAISRQRELLADASAVQFTRNPDGLAGALIQVRNNGGSYLANAHAEDMSHMCFVLPVKMHLQRWLSTHPPVDERLTALGEGWVARARARARQSGDPSPNPLSAPQAANVDGSLGFAPGASPVRVSSQVGTVKDADIDWAQTTLAQLPEEIRQSLRQPQGARRALLALILASNRNDTAHQLRQAGLADDQPALETLAEALRPLGATLRLPVIDLALPALKNEPRAAREQLLAELESLAKADNTFSLFEWALLGLARQQLGERAGRNRHTRFHRYGAVAAELQLLFSLLVWASGATQDTGTALFSRYTQGLLPAGRTLLPLTHCSSDKLFQAVDRLTDLSPLLKGPIIDSAVALAMDDGELKTRERETLRALSSLLECPLPPCFADH